MPFQDTGPATARLREMAIERAANDPEKRDHALKVVRMAIRLGLITRADVNSIARGRS